MAAFGFTNRNKMPGSTIPSSPTNKPNPSMTMPGQIELAGECLRLSGIVYYRENAEANDPHGQRGDDDPQHHDLLAQRQQGRPDRSRSTGDRGSTVGG